jgi:hypothetical protein
VTVFGEAGFGSVLEPGLARVYGGGVMLPLSRTLNFELRALTVDWTSSTFLASFTDHRRQTLFSGGMAIEGRPDELIRLLASAGVGALLYRRDQRGSQDAEETGTLVAPYAGAVMIVQASEHLVVRAGGTFWIGWGKTEASFRRADDKLLLVALNFTAGLGYQF